MSEVISRSAQRRADGVCTTCGSREPKPGLVTCSVCVERGVARHKRLREAKLCVECMAPSETRRCRVCLPRKGEGLFR